jgi:two-component system sensor histidine kinase VicK
VSGEEKTEVINGIENTIPLSLQCFAQVKERHDSWGDDTLPSVIVMTEPIKNAYQELLRRGIKTRFITEITEKNIEYCKELMKIVYELRHLEGIKANFSVSESDYIATAIQQQEGRPISQLIHSKARVMIEQQQYFFHTLWEKAIPAQIRIREIEEGVPVEKTEVIYGPDNAIRVALECYARAKERVDTCCDSTMPSAMISTPPIKNACSQAIKQGVKSRVITEITKENIEYCKEMIRMGLKSRHLDNVKGNFSVSERDYAANASQSPNTPVPLVIHSNAKAVIEQQQYFFETLWSKAIPARQRLKEIEQGAKTEFVETIREPEEIQQLAFDLIKRAEEEIGILFSMTDASRPQAKTGTLKLLQEAALSRGVKVRILVPISDDNETAIMANETICQLKDSGVDIRQIKKEERLYPHQNKLTLLVIDQSVCLTTELEENSEEAFEEAIGLATYSNSESTVFAYSSIFENLWIHAEIMLHD